MKRNKKCQKESLAPTFSTNIFKFTRWDGISPPASTFSTSLNVCQQDINRLITTFKVIWQVGNLHASTRLHWKSAAERHKIERSVEIRRDSSRIQMTLIIRRGIWNSPSRHGGAVSWTFNTSKWFPSVATRLYPIKPHHPVGFYRVIYRL